MLKASQTPSSTESPTVRRAATEFTLPPAPGVLPAPLAADSSEGDLSFSIVIPVRDEAESLESLYVQLCSALNQLERSGEVIFVDDGSTDRTAAILKELLPNDPRFRVIRLRRNFGQSAAFSAGFEYARGQVIVTMDGDLQNDPADIRLLLAKLDEGYDIASGWRIKRQDAFLTRRLPSQIANWLISSVTHVRLHDYGCSLKAYRREILAPITLYGEMHRFIPALASWMGVTVAEVPVRHAARKYGRSKYGLGRTVRVLLDLLTVKFLLDYATRPIQIFGLVGLISLAIGVALGAYLSYIKLILRQGIGDRPLLFLVVLLSVVGMQLIVLGLLGELVVRNYHQTRSQSLYMVREHWGGGAAREPKGEAG